MKNALLYLMTVLIWGSTWFAITFQLGEVNPLASVTYRFALASLILVAFCFATGHGKNLKFTRRQHLFIALQGVLLFAANYWFTYSATQYLASGVVSLCFSTMALMNALNQRFFFKMPIDKKVLFGSLFGLLGIALVFWHDIETLSFKDDIFIGLVVVFIGTYLASLGNMAALRNGRSAIPVLEGNALGMGYGALASFILVSAMGIEWNFEWTAGYITSLLYLTIFGSAIAFGSYLYLMKQIGADRVAYMTIMLPVVALTISTIFEDYQWRPEAIAGVGLIIAGNLFMIKRPKAKRPLA